MVEYGPLIYSKGGVWNLPQSVLLSLQSQYISLEDLSELQIVTHLAVLIKIQMVVPRNFLMSSLCFLSLTLSKKFHCLISLGQSSIRQYSYSSPLFQYYFLFVTRFLKVATQSRVNCLYSCMPIQDQRSLCYLYLKAFD